MRSCRRTGREVQQLAHLLARDGALRGRAYRARRARGQLAQLAGRLPDRRSKFSAHFEV